MSKPHIRPLIPEPGLVKRLRCLLSHDWQAVTSIPNRELLGWYCARCRKTEIV